MTQLWRFPCQFDTKLDELGSNEDGVMNTSRKLVTPRDVLSVGAHFSTVLLYEPGYLPTLRHSRLVNCPMLGMQGWLKQENSI